MIVIECVQGDEIWHQSRAGVTTASIFNEARKRVNGLNEQQSKYVEAILAGQSEKSAMEIAAYKAPPRAAVVEKALNGEKVGDFTDKAKQIAFKLAVERISGCLLAEEKFDTWEMRRGRELEPKARLKHEQKIDVLVEQTGIVLTDDRRFGASVDGLIKKDGSSEYKCFISPVSLMPILFDGDISDCIDQIQGGLWITGRKWCDFVLYCPALESINRDLTVIRIERDDEYIAKLELDLLVFDRLIDSYIAKLGGTPNPISEPKQVSKVVVPHQVVNKGDLIHEQEF